MILYDFYGSLKQPIVVVLLYKHGDFPMQPIDFDGSLKQLLHVRLMISPLLPEPNWKFGQGLFKAS